MIHSVKGVGVVIKAEVDVFLELSCFLNDRTDVGNLNVKVMCPLHIVKNKTERQSLFSRVILGFLCIWSEHFQLVG